MVAVVIKIHISKLTLQPLLGLTPCETILGKPTSNSTNPRAIEILQVQNCNTDIINVLIFLK